MAILLGIGRGSNLNSSWGKCGFWLVDWWIPSLCASLCLSYHSTLRILMWWFSMLDCYIHLWHWHADDIDRLCSCHDYSAHFDSGDFLCLIVISICDIGMLMILIDSTLAMIILLTLTVVIFYAWLLYPFVTLACWWYWLILLLPWLFCSPWHVHSFFCLSHSSWHDWFS